MKTEHRIGLWLALFPMCVGVIVGVIPMAGYTITQATGRWVLSCAVIVGAATLGLYVAEHHLLARKRELKGRYGKVVGAYVTIAILIVVGWMTLSAPRQAEGSDLPSGSAPTPTSVQAALRNQIAEGNKQVEANLDLESQLESQIREMRGDGSNRAELQIAESKLAQAQQNVQTLRAAINGWQARLNTLPTG